MNPYDPPGFSYFLDPAEPCDAPDESVSIIGIERVQGGVGRVLFEVQEPIFTGSIDLTRRLTRDPRYPADMHGAPFHWIWGNGEVPRFLDCGIYSVGFAEGKYFFRKEPSDE